MGSSLEQNVLFYRSISLLLNETVEIHNIWKLENLTSADQFFVNISPYHLLSELHPILAIYPAGMPDWRFFRHSENRGVLES